PKIHLFHDDSDLAGLIASRGVDQKLAVKIDAHAVIGHRAELICARFRRRELARPARRETVFIYFRRRSAATPIEIDLLIRSDERGLALQFLVVEILGLAAARSGRSRDGCARVAGQRRAERVENSL